MVDLNQLYNFIDLGGIFILSIFLCYLLVKKFDGMEDKLAKILALLTILVKQTTKFNDVEDVLGADKTKVEQYLNSSIKKI